MAITNASISARTYELLHSAFDHFNSTLFDDRLPPAMLVLHRKRGAHGYFHAEQWRLRGEEEDGEGGMHEIALNPQTMGRDARAVLSTLVHEMTHHEQQSFGKPSKGGHHNEEWAKMMDAVGLTPTDTGNEGGKRTGRKVTHMIESGGAFEVACDTFLRQNPDAVGVFAITAPVSEKKRDTSKVPHQCPSCDAKVWGKLGIRVFCGDCDDQMLPDPKFLGEDD